jgi:VPDSG-CTERM motif
MFQKKMLLVLMVVVLMWASEARATAILTIGNDPQIDENVLLNTALTGNPIFGKTNDTGLVVRFTGSENLTAPANGQARIEAADALFTSLMIDVPSGSFTSLILNPDATMDGMVDFTVTTNTGVQLFNDVELSGNGNNFFTFTTTDGQRYLSIAFEADVPLEDAAQFRIGGVQLLTPDPRSVPDATSALPLLGLGVAAIAVARRRFARS